MNIKNIISYFTNYDASGTSGQDIDTMLEYKMLGEYLNGNMCIENTRYPKLSKKNKKILKELYDKAKSSLNDFFNNNNNIPKITPSNIRGYVELYYNLQGSSPNLDNETKRSLEKLKLGIQVYIKNNGIKTDNLNLSGDEYDLDKIMNFISLGQTISDLQNQKNSKTFRLINNPYDNKKLEKIATMYIKDNNISPLNTTDNEVDLGNGLFDKFPKQLTGNCWLHAGINSLLNTAQGKALLKDNRFYDPVTGIYVIHLQEAEDNNLHDGIYIITPEDIKAGSKDSSRGEGDVTAYIIAVERYFKEAKTNKDISARPKQFDNPGVGNHTFRFFEIITGGEMILLDNRADNPTILLQKGISWHNTNSIKYDELYNIIERGSAACVLAIGDTFNGGHALSVVGVKNGNLLIQESNAIENFHETYFDENGKTIFKKSEDINGAPTFEVSKENYKYLITPALLKFL